MKISKDPANYTPKEEYISIKQYWQGRIISLKLLLLLFYSRLMRMTFLDTVWVCTVFQHVITTGMTQHATLFTTNHTRDQGQKESL